MRMRLNSQRDPSRVLILTDAAWFALLDLAEGYGWNPFGPILPGQWHALEPDLGGYNPSELDDIPPQAGRNGQRLVILDDALNLADALENAFMDYEPQRVPASFYLFEPDDSRIPPSLGALRETIEICHLGAFWIEEFHLNG